jgi:hypothetical protein
LIHSFGALLGGVFKTIASPLAEFGSALGHAMVARGIFGAGAGRAAAVFGLIRAGLAKAWQAAQIFYDRVMSGVFEESVKETIIQKTLLAWVPDEYSEFLVEMFDIATGGQHEQEQSSKPR